MSVAAMKQALEALDSFSPYSGNTWIQESEVDIDSAITALRQAIEQAEKQEPVGLFSINDYGNWEQNESNYGAPLYFNPLKPEWVGLTDEEIDVIQELPLSQNDYLTHYAYAIAAKLKEKNRG
jgi:hypothetical protein